ncbi:MAG: hypothetical protein HYY13_00140 [Nitrospirae bacterium]|nr:hypothetical protein [Nitrospirota bacterium]
MLEPRATNGMTRAQAHGYPERVFEVGAGFQAAGLSSQTCILSSARRL